VGWFWWVLGILIVVMWVFTFVDIVRRRHERSRAQTAAWLIVVLVLPIVGTVIYFLVNGSAGSGARNADELRLPGGPY
jgi:Phospholipase_D-nuclease N-terminal